MPESSSRSFPTVPTALSALTAQSMTPDAPLPHPPSLGAGALLRWLLRRAAVPVTLATLAACTSNIIQAIVPAFLGQALDAGIENGLNARIWGIGALLLVLALYTGWRRTRRPTPAQDQSFAVIAPSATPLAVEAALEAFGLAPLRHRFLDEISGGQAQRAHLAMTFAQGTDWLLLDEPLNNLDMAHSRALMARLADLVRGSGRSVVTVVHEVNYAAAWADHVVAMKNGRVVAQGPAEAQAGIKALLTGARAALMDAQLDAEVEPMAIALASAEAGEGIAAFLGKRAPDFAALRRR